MSVELIKKTETFLKKNKNDMFSKSRISKELHMNYNILINILTYLHTERKIRTEKRGNIEVYGWRERKQ